MKNILIGLKQFYELQVDPDFRDMIQRGSDRMRLPDKDDVEYAKRNMDKYPDDDYFKRQYERALARYNSSNAFDRLYQKIYNSTHIDLNQATIEKVPVPQNGKDGLALIKNGKPTILSSGEKLFLFGEGGWIVYYSAALNDTATVNGKTLNLDSDRNIVRAFNAGVFDNAWKINGPSTDELRAQRAGAKSGSVQRDRRMYVDSDKSGYRKRDLRKELADKKRTDYTNQIDDIKKQAVDLRRQLVQKIKTGDLEDIDVSTFNSISKALNNLESVNRNDYDLRLGNSEDAKAYIDRANRYLDNLKNVVDNF